MKGKTPPTSKKTSDKWRCFFGQVLFLRSEINNFYKYLNLLFKILTLCIIIKLITNWLYTKDIKERVLMNYVNLEVMSATSKVVEALKVRGFFVEEVNGAIIYTKACAKADIAQTLHILNRLGIPFMVLSNHSVEILVNKLPNSVFKKIFQFDGAPFHVNFEERHTTWRYFTSKRFGMRVDALDLEYNMARFVKTANLAGITTFAGCNGHLIKSPRFQFSGVFHGAWFKAVQQKYMSDLMLNYNWEVLYQGFTQAELRATGNVEFNQSLIHQDTLKMAEVLEKYATEIRETKKHTFSKHQTEPKNLDQHEQYNKLEDWMYLQAFQTK